MTGMDSLASDEQSSVFESYSRTDESLGSFQAIGGVQLMPLSASLRMAASDTTGRPPYASMITGVITKCGGNKLSSLGLLHRSHR